MNETEQARLLEIYLSALRQDPYAKPPTGLDAETASFIRRMLNNQPASRLDDLKRSQIWEQALSHFNEKETPLMIQTRTMPQKTKFSITWGALVAVFVVIALGGTILANLNKHSTNNYLSVYPLMTETPTAVSFMTPMQEQQFVNPTVDRSDLDLLYYATATQWIVERTLTAESENGINTHASTIIPSEVYLQTPTAYVLFAGATAVVSDHRGVTLGSLCQDIDLDSAECFYRMGNFLIVADMGEEQYTEGLNYLRIAFNLLPKLEYRYGLALALAQVARVAQCDESKALLMEVMDESDGNFLNNLAQYAYHCQDIIELPSGLRVGRGLSELDSVLENLLAPSSTLTATPLSPTVTAVPLLMTVTAPRTALPPTAVPTASVAITMVPFMQDGVVAPLFIETAEQIRDQYCAGIDIESAECFYRMGERLSSFGLADLTEQGIDYLRRALEAEPNNTTYSRGLAVGLLRSGECEGTKDLLLQEDMNIDVGNLLAEYAIVCQDNVRLRSGVEIVAPTLVPSLDSITSFATGGLSFDDLCMNIDPESAACAYNKATFLMDMPTYLETALDYIRQAVELEPEEPRYQQVLGYILAKLRQCPESREILIPFVDEDSALIRQLFSVYAQNCQEEINGISFINASTIPISTIFSSHVPVQLANVEIEAGTVIEADMVFMVYWSRNSLPEGLFSVGDGDIIGRVASEHIARYQPIFLEQVRLPD